MIATVDHKLGDSVHVNFQETSEGPVIFDQYIDREDWEFDVEGIVAKFARNYASMVPEAAAETYDNAEKSRVEMSEAQITGKLAAIKEAEDIAKEDKEKSEEVKKK